MLTRQIPATGQVVPVIGLGTWQTFDPPRLDETRLTPLQEVLRVFHEAGGRVVDSSPMYGRAEQILGLLSSRLGISHDLFLATKVWTNGQTSGLQQMRQSLDRLQRHSLELMQIHNLVDWRTHLKTLRQWKDQGRFRYIGITHYEVASFADLEWIIEHEQIDFVQFPYSVGLRHAERRLLPLAQDRSVAVLINRPLEEGSLLRRVRHKPLPDFVRGFASSWTEAFLKFIIAHPAVTCVIPATSKPQHMHEILAAGEGRLPDEDERRRLGVVAGTSRQSVAATVSALPRRARYWLSRRAARMGAWKSAPDAAPPARGQEVI